ncbi:MAG: DUF3131 domain-containing protein [Alicyclobacillus sp.]|nr:DUF3131 domain-containing protein [Alicyclobacillus sp.]
MRIPYYALVAAAVSSSCLLAAAPLTHAASASAVSGSHISVADTKLLKSTASQTWRYFVQATDNPTGLPADRIDIVPKDQGGYVASSNTSPTNIGLYLMSIVAARDLGIIRDSDAENRVQKLAATLGRLGTWHGFLYNWYDVATGSPASGDSSRFVSTVDNGWYAAGLMVARQAFPGAKSVLTKLLNAMDFSKLYDPSAHQMYGGYDPVQKTYPTWHFGNLNTESRVADYIAIGQGKVPQTLWWHVYRTLPSSEDQAQTPQGKIVMHDGVPVFEGHYTWGGLKYVPSWGGSMFEALMPSLVLEEQQLAPHGFGLNDERMVQLQIRWANVKHYPAWGISPCATPNDGYGVYGVPPLGSAASPYDEDGTVTPHATFLALAFDPQAALANLKVLRSKYDVMGPFGYYDSVNVHTGIVAKSDLALDEGMILVAIDNFLNRDKVQMYFNRDPVGRKPQHLLTTENFLIQ